MLKLIYFRLQLSKGNYNFKLPYAIKKRITGNYNYKIYDLIR